MTMLDDRDKLLLDTLRALTAAYEEIGRLQAELGLIPTSEIDEIMNEQEAGRARQDKARGV